MKQILSVELVKKIQTTIHNGNIKIEYIVVVVVVLQYALHLILTLMMI